MIFFQWTRLSCNFLNWPGATVFQVYWRIHTKQRENGGKGWGMPVYTRTGLKFSGKRSYIIMSLIFLVQIVVLFMEEDERVQHWTSTAKCKTWWRLWGCSSSSGAGSLVKMRNYKHKKVRSDGIWKASHQEQHHFSAWQWSQTHRKCSKTKYLHRKTLWMSFKKFLKTT